MCQNVQNENYLNGELCVIGQISKGQTAELWMRFVKKKLIMHDEVNW